MKKFAILWLLANLFGTLNGMAGLEQEIRVTTEGSLQTTFSGQIAMNFESPLFVNLSLLPNRFEVGAYAIYQAETETGELFLHSFKVLSIKEIEGKFYFEVSISRDLPPASTMNLYFPSADTDPERFGVAKAAASFDPVSGASFSGLHLETFVDEARVTPLEVMGSRLETLHRRFTAGKGTTGELWIKQGYGPLGIVQAKVFREGGWVIYRLIDCRMPVKIED